MAEVTRLEANKPVLQLLRVAAYARVSTASERQLSSLSNQVSHYSRLIQSTPGWTYAGVFLDEGITATSIVHRQGLADLMAAARAGQIDLVLCKSISRMARNTVDLLEIIRELKTLGVAVRFEREGIDTATAEGELLLTLLASFAQEESRSLSENVKWAIRNRYKQGGTNSFWIYGYAWTGTGFTIVEEEAAIIRRVFTSYLQGVSPDACAKQLNAEGHRSRAGGLFYGSITRRWLENERYKGCQMLQKTYNHVIRAVTSATNDGVLPKYWVEGALPAIISPEVFDQVQAEIARRRQIGPASFPNKSATCFTSRIRCAVCGRHYQRKARTYPSGTSYRYWRCASACKGCGNPCGGHNLRETALQTACMQALGCESFDDQVVYERIDLIEAHADQLDIYLSDGTSHTMSLDENGRIF